MTVVQEDAASVALATAFSAANVEGFVHAKDLENGNEVGYRSDAAVVSASVFKIPVLVTLFRHGDAGIVDLAERVTVPAEGRAPGPTGLSILLDPVAMSWRDLATLMIVISDNTATDVICDRVGVSSVDAAMDTLGFPQTRVPYDCRGIFDTILRDSGLDSFQDVPPTPTQEFLDGLRALRPMETVRTTPREMARLLELIWTDRAASPESCEHMRKILRSMVWQHRLASGFPEDDVATAGKTGTLPTIRNEAGVVEFKDGRRFAVAVFTRAKSLTAKNPAADAVIGRAARIAVDALRSRP